MDSKFDLFDGGRSDSNAPPAYDAVSTSSMSAYSIQSRPQSVFSKEQTEQIRTTVLSLIRDIVTAPDFVPSSVGSIIDACVASLPTAEFTALLQESNIEGHTPVYWAVVNNRPEALAAFLKFINTFTSGGCEDMRLACMATSDHALFMKLQLASYYNESKPLDRCLGCPTYDAQVSGGDTQNQFIAKMQIGMFQKRMRVAHSICVELISQGRIWRLVFSMGTDTGGQVSLSLAEHSLPARPKALFTVEAHNGQPKSLEILFQLKKKAHLLAPVGYVNNSIHTCTFLSASLGGWVMFDDTMYTDSDGTLHVRLEVTLE
ncbi:hypothetical protein BDR07DRAFT_1606128 [Suillus spraguei]|nr:hypothetical protein BDR07DRAFT_1606128 [Suillus spraguei]